MKKILFLLLTVLVLCTLIGCDDTAEKENSNNKNNSKINMYEEYSYVAVKDEYIMLNIYLGDEKNPEIPEKIDGKPVKIIGLSCFASSEIESITVPDTVTEIWEMAFLNCKKLTNVALSKNTVKIGNKSFEGCTSLQSIELPEALQTIDVYAFFGCSALNKLTVPKNVTTVGTYAFMSSGITELKFLGDAPTEIGDLLLNDDAIIYYPADANGWDNNKKLSSYTLEAY